MSNTLQNTTDESLFESYRAGDFSAFRSLVDRHHDDLMRFLTRLLSETTAADDVFQETFLQVHQAADTFDSSRRFRPWLFTIAANKARDYLRRKGRRKTLDLSAPLDGDRGDEGSSGTFVDLLEVRFPSPDAAMNEAETSRLVQQALDQLPHSLREILLLAYFQKLTYAQIASELEIPLGTVKSRLHSAVAEFARRWNAASPAAK